MSRPGQRPIVIVGAGPAGLSAALALAAEGVPVAVFEAEPALPHDLRAGSYHPPTLEMLAPYGVTARMHEEGIVVRKWQIRDREAGLVAEFDLDLLKDETPYPYRLHLEQHKLTPLLLEALTQFPHATVHFAAPAVAARQTADCAFVTVEQGGERREIAADYAIGADGARSVMRAAMESDFEGFTWPEAFLIVSTTHDFEPHGYARATYIADPEEWVMLFKVPGFNPPPLWRMALPADPERPREETTDPAVVQRRLQRFLPRKQPYDIVHANTYRVHQRVARRFHHGRLAIAGDAAHVNNPLGGMGLNGAVHDAVNLADKLVRIRRGEGGAELLALYTRQRRPPQIDHVQRITIRNKELVEEKDPAARAAKLDELRAIVADEKAHFAYLMDTSMINSVRHAARIV